MCNSYLFFGVIFDTDYNRKYFILIDQYRNYCSKLILPLKLITGERELIGISGNNYSIETERIPI